VQYFLNKFWIWIKNNELNNKN